MKIKRFAIFIQIGIYGSVLFFSSANVLWGEPKGKIVISTAYDLPTMDPHMHGMRPRIKK